MIDVRKATEKIAELGMLPFFPTEQNARTGVIGIVCSMADDNHQVDWIIRRCLQLWSKWEGPSELRAVFCSKFKPKDGIDVFSQLPQFLDGIPSEAEATLQGPAGYLGGQSSRLLAGETMHPNFPTDSMSLLADVIRQHPKQAPVPTESDIAAIKAEQDRNRKEWNGSEAGER